MHYVLKIPRLDKSHDDHDDPLSFLTIPSYFAGYTVFLAHYLVRLLSMSTRPPGYFMTAVTACMTAVTAVAHYLVRLLSMSTRQDTS